MQTAVELPEFQRRAKLIMTDAEREATILWIAENPEAGTSLGAVCEKYEYRVRVAARAAASERYTSLEVAIYRFS